MIPHKRNKLFTLGIRNARLLMQKISRIHFSAIPAESPENPVKTIKRQKKVLSHSSFASA